MKQIEIYTVGFSLPTLVGTCDRKDLARELEAHDLLGKCVMLRAAGDLHDSDTVEPMAISRRPTLEELAVGTPVMVRGWDEMENNSDPVLLEKCKHKSIWVQESIYAFLIDMEKYCGNTYKVTEKFLDSVELDGCEGWKFTPQMLTYIAPEVSK